MESDIIFVTADEENCRLDKLLALRFPNFSRTYFQYLINEKLVLVNGALVKKRTPLKEGDEIEIEFAATPEISLEPEDIPLNILYEDDHIIAVNKPPGMVVHPAVGNWTHTFVNALLYHCQLEQKEGVRPGIVHRLDKDTSGVLLAAKTERAQQKLVALFAERSVKKEYLAICIGNPGIRTIDAPIGRHPIHRKEMAIIEKGKEARTHVQTISYDNILSIVRLIPETGRTHQLRVHLKSIGVPILGDSIYGNPAINKKYGAQRQLLHAEKLSFIHPILKEEIELKAPIPQDIEVFIKAIEKK